MKKNVLGLLIGAVCVLSVQAKDQDGDVKRVEDENGEELFVKIENMPAFPGGESELFLYLGESVVYPSNAKEKGIEGVVYSKFVVETDGSITNVEVIRGIGDGCDEAARDAIAAMPNWSPGEIDGKPVRVEFKLPIRFTLRKKEEKDED